MAVTTYSTELTLRELGQRLRQARIDHGDRQSDMAARLGVTRQTIGRMEKGDPATAIGLWLAAARTYGLAESWEELMLQPPDPFEEFDHQHASNDALLKKRVRRP